MRFLNLLALAGLALSAAIPLDDFPTDLEVFTELGDRAVDDASGNATIDATEGGKNPCKNQKTGKCKFPGHHNTHLTYHHRVNWGSVLPHQLVDKLHKACDADGVCHPVSAKSTFISKDHGVTYGKVTIKQIGQAGWAHGMKGPMLDLMRKLVTQQTKHHKRTGGSCVDPCSECPPSCTSTTDTQHIAPKTFAIKIPAKYLYTAAFKVHIDKYQDDESICADVFGSAAAIGGIVGGEAAPAISGGLSLASIFCDA